MEQLISSSSRIRLFLSRPSAIATTPSSPNLLLESRICKRCEWEV